MAARIRVVSTSEILAHPRRSLLPLDYDNDGKRASLIREATRLRARAGLLMARAEKLEAQAAEIPPNQHPTTGGDR